jgi:hypothetical protein
MSSFFLEYRTYGESEVRRIAAAQSDVPVERVKKRSSSHSEGAVPVERAKEEE